MGAVWQTPVYSHLRLSNLVFKGTINFRWVVLSWHALQTTDTDNQPEHHCSHLALHLSSSILKPDHLNYVISLNIVWPRTAYSDSGITTESGDNVITILGKKFCMKIGLAKQVNWFCILVLCAALKSKCACYKLGTKCHVTLAGSNR